MGVHWGATLGLVFSFVQTVRAYKEGGWHRVKVAWTGLDSNYPGEWFPAQMDAAIPLGIGSTATFLAIKSGFNSWTPKYVNV